MSHAENAHNAVYAHDRNVEILFDGSKIFWRANVTADIAIIRHAKVDDAIEIIVSNPSASMEFPRLYLDHEKLFSDKRIQHVEDKLSKKAVQALSPMEQTDAAGYKRSIMDDLIVRYVMSRVCVVMKEDEYGRIKQCAELVPKCGDPFVFDEHRMAKLTTLQKKPVCLRPVQTLYQQSKESSAFSGLLNMFDGDLFLLIAAIDRAAKLIRTLPLEVYKASVTDGKNKPALNPAKLRWQFAIRKVLDLRQMQMLKKRVDTLVGSSKRRGSLANPLLSAVANASDYERRAAKTLLRAIEKDDGKDPHSLQAKIKRATQTTTAKNVLNSLVIPLSAQKNRDELFSSVVLHEGSTTGGSLRDQLEESYGAKIAASHHTENMDLMTAMTMQVLRTATLHPASATSMGDQFSSILMDTLNKRHTKQSGQKREKQLTAVASTASTASTACTSLDSGGGSMQDSLALTSSTSSSIPTGTITTLPDILKVKDLEQHLPERVRSPKRKLCPEIRHGESAAKKTGIEALMKFCLERGIPASPDRALSLFDRHNESTLQVKTDVAQNSPYKQYQQQQQQQPNAQTQVVKPRKGRRGSLRTPRSKNKNSKHGGIENAVNSAAVSVSAEKQEQEQQAQEEREEEEEEEEEDAETRAARIAVSNSAGVPFRPSAPAHMAHRKPGRELRGVFDTLGISVSVVPQEPAASNTIQQPADSPPAVAAAAAAAESAPLSEQSMISNPLADLVEGEINAKRAAAQHSKDLLQDAHCAYATKVGEIQTKRPEFGGRRWVAQHTDDAFSSTTLSEPRAGEPGNGKTTAPSSESFTVAARVSAGSDGTSNTQALPFVLAGHPNGTSAAGTVAAATAEVVAVVDTNKENEKNEESLLPSPNKSSTRDSASILSASLNRNQEQPHRPQAVKEQEKDRPQDKHAERALTVEEICAESSTESAIESGPNHSRLHPHITSHRRLVAAHVPATAPTRGPARSRSPTSPPPGSALPTLAAAAAAVSSSSSSSSCQNDAAAVVHIASVAHIAHPPLRAAAMGRG